MKAGAEKISGEMEAGGVRGDEDAIGGDEFADRAAAVTPGDVKTDWIAGIDPRDFRVFGDGGAGANGGAGEAVHDFAGVDGAAGNFFDGAKAAGIGPIDGGIWQGFDFFAVHGTVAVGDFPDAAEVEGGVDAKSAEDLFVVFEDVAEGGKISGGGFREGEAAGAAAGAVAEAFCFEEKDGFIFGETFERSGGGEAGEAGADDGEIDVRRKASEFGAERDFPGRSAPVGSGRHRENKDNAERQRVRRESEEKTRI